MKKLMIPAGSIVRNRTHQKAYDVYRRKHPAADCQFCAFTLDLDHVLEEYPQFWIVRNIFPYHIWDGSRTGEHLMLIPKRHVDSISHFTPEERADYIDILAEYDAKGYSMYARSPLNQRKSVTHQHTHLIEVGERLRAQFFIERPHINITR